MKLATQIALGLCLVLAGAAFAADADAWGEAKNGLQISLKPRGDAAVGGKVVFDVTLRNAGAVPAPLGAGKDVFAWLFVAQKGSERGPVFTDKLFPAAKRADWPEALEPEKTLEFGAVEFSTVPAHPYESQKMVRGYPVADEGELAAAGPLNGALIAGPVKARLMFFIARPDGPALLVSNTLDLQIAPAKVTATGTTAELLKQFDRDAFAAKKAHDDAVKLGKKVLPDLIAAANQPKRPDYSRLWLATAVADIPDDTAAQALIGLLADPNGGVRCVVAYHGVKQKSAKLDAAILARAKTDKDPGFTAYALLGFMVHRNRVPPELLKTGLESDDARARAAAVQALAGMASDYNRERLNALLKDPDAQVRATAKKVLDAMKN
jgi:hypothetical protein